MLLVGYSQKDDSDAEPASSASSCPDFFDFETLNPKLSSLNV